MPRSTWLGRGALGALTAAVATIWLFASGTLSTGFSTSSITNDTNSTRVTTLAISHSYPSGAGTSACASPTSAASAASATCPGSLLPPTLGTRPDTITNTGDLGPAATTATLGLSACGPRQLAVGSGTGSALLPRGGTALNWTSGTSGKAATDSNPLPGAGSVSFAAATSDYASTAAKVPDPIATTGLTSNAGAFGVWFKTSAAAGGLLSFDTVAQVPGTATGANAFALYLSGGKVGLRTSNAYSTALTPATYNNNAWHFAYATIDQTTIAGLVTGTTARIYMDGAATAAVTAAPGVGLLGGPPVSPLNTGYWLLGWSQADGYLTGSESDFLVSTNTAAATSTALYSATSQTAFAAASTPTTLWPLNDEGNSVYAGSYPVAGGAASPCGTVNLTDFGTTQSLAATLSTPIAATIPAPGASATYTATLAAGTGYTANAAYAAGLQIYAPTRFTVSTTSGGYRTVFDWNAAGTSTTNPNSAPTFVLT